MKFLHRILVHGILNNTPNFTRYKKNTFQNLLVEPLSNYIFLTNTPPSFTRYPIYPFLIPLFYFYPYYGDITKLL
jgi:hypothetical protein